MAFEASKFLVKICFFRVAVNSYVPIFRGLDAHGALNYEHTHTHTHTQGITTVTLSADACKGLIKYTCMLHTVW